MYQVHIIMALTFNVMMLRHLGYKYKTVVYNYKQIRFNILYKYDQLYAQYFFHFQPNKRPSRLKQVLLNRDKSGQGQTSSSHIIIIINLSDTEARLFHENLAKTWLLNNDLVPCVTTWSAVITQYMSNGNILVFLEINSQQTVTCHCWGMLRNTNHIYIF